MHFSVHYRGYYFSHSVHIYNAVWVIIRSIARAIIRTTLLEPLFNITGTITWVIIFTVIETILVGTMYIRISYVIKLEI